MKRKKISEIINADESMYQIVTYRISLTETPEFSEGNFVFDKMSRVQARYIDPICNSLSKAYKTAVVKVVERLPYIDFNILDDQQELFDETNLVLAPDFNRIEDELVKNANQTTPCDPRHVASNIRALEFAKHFCKKELNPQIFVGDEVFDAPHIPQKHFAYSPGEQSDSVISHDIRITGFNTELFANLQTLVAISANKDYEILIEGKNKVAFELVPGRILREEDVYIVGGIYFDRKLRNWIMNPDAYFD
jgi:hypothetical protein